VDAAETTPTHSVAGPLSDGLTWIDSEGGRIQRSIDAGCNWEGVGNLPASGWWELQPAGDRVYAFDRGSSDAARSDDQGVSWTPFDTGGTFVGDVTVDPADPARLRGMQERGVVSSTDGGDSWQVTGTAPAGTLRDASVSPQDLDTIVVGTDVGISFTRGGGTTWDEVGATFPQDATVPGITVPQVAVHPDDADVLFAVGQDTTGLYSVARSPDHGGTWALLVTSQALNGHLDDTSELWPVPGNTDQALLTYGSSLDAYGIDLHTMTLGDSTRSLHVGGWSHIEDVDFGADRVIAAVDGSP
jgi:hypothetical protein